MLEIQRLMATVINGKNKGWKASWYFQTESQNSLWNNLMWFSSLFIFSKPGSIIKAFRPLVGVFLFPLMRFLVNWCYINKLNWINMAKHWLTNFDWISYWKPQHLRNETDIQLLPCLHTKRLRLIFKQDSLLCLHCQDGMSNQIFLHTCNWWRETREHKVTQVTHLLYFYLFLVETLWFTKKGQGSLISSWNQAFTYLWQKKALNLQTFKMSLWCSANLLLF